MRRTIIHRLFKAQPVILGIAALFVSTTLLADDAPCKRDAVRAFSTLTSSGPFRYETKQVENGSLLRESGEIVPGSAQHVLIHSSNETPNEGIQIGGMAWTNDGSGWAAPIATARTILSYVPEFPFQIKQARCGDIVNLDGRKLDLFDIKMTDASAPRQTLYVDTTTKLPVRLERTNDDENLEVTTYSFDSSIRIAAPPVDLNGRRRRSETTYHQSVAGSDPQCRARVLKAVQRANAIGSFTFKVQGRLVAGISAITGFVVTPNALHYKLVGLTSHGGGNERVVIGTQVWDKVFRWSHVKHDGGYLKTFLASALPDTTNIGATVCPKTIDTRLSVYEYDFYQDTGTAREFVEHRRLTIRERTGAPAKIETLDAHGNVLRIENRHYRADISIEPPLVGSAKPVRHANRR